jgi:acetoin utilization protein AcuB
MFVHQCMSARVITIKGVTPVQLAQTLMLSHHIHRLPVVDENKILMGLLTDRRLKQMMASLGSASASGELKQPVADVKVQDIMMTRVVTISPDAMVSEAVVILHKHNIGCLPVVNEAGKMVGIITINDVMRISHYILYPEKKGAYIYIGGGIGQEKLLDILQIIHKHQAKIRMILHVKTRDIVIQMDVDDVTPIKEELKARKYICSITSYPAA